jgi:hypothetical protein
MNLLRGLLVALRTFYLVYIPQLNGQLYLGDINEGN